MVKKQNNTTLLFFFDCPLLMISVLVALNQPLRADKLAFQYHLPNSTQSVSAVMVTFKDVIARSLYEENLVTFSLTKENILDYTAWLMMK